MNPTPRSHDPGKLEHQFPENNEGNKTSNPDGRGKVNINRMQIEKQNAQDLPSPVADHRQNDEDPDPKEDAETDEEPYKDA